MARAFENHREPRGRRKSRARTNRLDGKINYRVLSTSWEIEPDNRRARLDTVPALTRALMRVLNPNDAPGKKVLVSFTAATSFAKPINCRKRIHQKAKRPSKARWE